MVAASQRAVEAQEVEGGGLGGQLESPGSVAASLGGRAAAPGSSALCRVVR